MRFLQADLTVYRLTFWTLQIFIIFEQYLSTIRFRTKSIVRIKLFFIFLFEVDIPFISFTSYQSRYNLRRYLLGTVILRTIKNVITWAYILINVSSKAIVTECMVASLFGKLGGYIIAYRTQYLSKRSDRFKIWVHYLSSTVMLSLCMEESNLQDINISFRNSLADRWSSGPLHAM